MDEQSPMNPENMLDHKWDRCISNFIIKLGTAGSIGLITSVILFKRKSWPVAMSAGFGLGVAYEQCQRSFDPSINPMYNQRITAPIVEVESTQQVS